MTDTFLSKDPVKALSEIRVQLYDRLANCCDLINSPRYRYATHGSGFDAGVNCRTVDELDWIRDMLDLIERS